jgi:hypothetical protein
MVEISHPFRAHSFLATRAPLLSCSKDAESDLVEELRDREFTKVVRPIRGKENHN